MLRRSFLGLGAAALAPACTRKIHAVAFDLFTLFDARSVNAAADAIAPGLAEVWRTRQFEYTWIRTSAGRYRDFEAVTDDALVYAAAARGVTLTREARNALCAEYTRLSPWDDTLAALDRLRAAGVKLAPLTNFTPAMTERLLASRNLRGYFDFVLSTDQVKTYKPDVRAYELAPKAFGLAREEIGFAAFGGWDAAGARWFGFPTFWVNRLKQPMEQLDPGPNATGSTLTELANWVLA